MIEKFHVRNRCIALTVSCLLILISANYSHGFTESSHADDATFSWSDMMPLQGLFSGKAKYSVPIEVPPGRAGLSPELELSYNSYRRNGWLGVGWDIKIGAIQRNVKQGLNYSAKDFVVIKNGKAIELVERPEWGANVYGEKIEGTFTRYYFYGSSGWMAATKEGSVFYYGQLESSCQYEASSGDTFQWCLDKVKDANGNFIEITYTKDSGQIYPLRIDYTGHEGIGPSNSIEFVLEDRISGGFHAETFTDNDDLSSVCRDITPGDFNGDGLTDFLRRDGPCVAPYPAQGDPKIYFSKGDGSFNVQPIIDQFNGLDPDARLVTGDYNGDGVTDFIYQSRSYSEICKIFLSNHIDPGTFEVHDLTGYDSPLYIPNATLISGDYNGDGMTDFIRQRTPTSYPLSPGHSGYDFSNTQIFFSNGDGTFDVRLPTNYHLLSNDCSSRLTPGDYNGDGMTDFIRQEFYRCHVENAYCQVKDHADMIAQVYLSNGDGTFDVRTIESPVPIGGWLANIIPGDYNGDGLADFVRQERIYGSALTADERQQIRDGTRIETGNHLFLSKGDGSFEIKEIANSGGLSVILHDSYPTMVGVVPGDYNGDGLSDFIRYRTMLENSWDLEAEFYLSKGDGTFFLEVADDYNSLGRQKVNIILGDFNGDSTTDFIRQGNWPPDSSSNLSYIFLSKNDSPIQYRTKSEVATTKRLGQINIYASGQLTRSYQLEYMSSPSTSRSLLTRIRKFGSQGNELSPTTFEWHKEGGNIGNANFDYITKVTTDMGSVFAIGYTPSSKYDNLLMPGIIHPVSKITADHGGGYISEHLFSYKDGYYDFPSREFRGFKENLHTYPNGTIEKTIFFQGRLEPEDPYDIGDNYYLKGRPNYVVSRENSDESSDAHLIRRTEYLFGQRDESEDSQFVFLDHTISKEYEGGQLVLETHADPISYDAVGNLESVETWDTSNTAEKIIKTYTYSNLGGDTEPRWRKAMEMVEGENSGLVRKTWYRYTSDGSANLEEKELFSDTGDNPIISYSYDEFGNVKKQWDACSNKAVDPPTTIYEYDTDTQTFPVKVTNALNQVKQTGWNLQFGKEQWTLDANGIRTDFQYDEFGRFIQATVTDQQGRMAGRAITEYYLNQAPRYIKKRVLETENPESYIDTYQYVDGQGHTIQTISMGIQDGNLTPVVTRTFYDNMDREKENWGPYFGCAISYPSDPIDADVPRSWTDFDLRSRPIDIHSSDAQYTQLTTHYDYNGLSTTVTDPDGSKKTSIKDYLGRVVEVVEHTETDELHTTYAYNAANDLLTVIDVLGNVTTMSYDTLGRKLDVHDPDKGFWQYGYDANGNIIWQKDAKNQEIEFSYDALNRILLKHYPSPGPYDHDVSYVYDDATITLTNPIGKLSRVSTTVTTTTYNEYDSYGNATRVTEMISGDSLPRTNEYYFDLAGRSSSTVYPDGYQVNYNYYGGTSLLENVVSISDQTHFVTYADYQATGKIKKAVFGNSVVTTYSYDAFSGRLTSVQTAGPDGNVLMDLSYTYTRAGDIESIDNAMGGNTRYYEYDGLHRLVRESSSTDDYTYLKPNILDFSYDATKPLHGVGSIDNLGTVQEFAYDANGNMTSAPDLSNPYSPSSRTITYNRDNMPVTIIHSANGTTNLYYDGGGKRVKKVNGANTTYYINRHAEIINGQTVKYIFLGDQRIAMIDDGGTSYYHKDHLGSSSVMTDSSGSLLQASDYLPFGGNRNEGSRITYTNYQFTDQELDAETRLYNYDARLYDTTTGLFLTPDSIIPDWYTPQELNRYSHCLNNPLTYIDPDGHLVVTTTVLLSGLVSLVVDYLIEQHQSGKSFSNYYLSGEYSIGRGVTATAAGFLTGGAGAGIAARPALSLGQKMLFNGVANMAIDAGKNMVIGENNTHGSQIAAFAAGALGQGVGWAFDKTLNLFFTKEVLTLTRAGYTTTLNASGNPIPFATGTKTVSAAWMTGFITGEVSGNLAAQWIGYQVSRTIDSRLLKKLKQERGISFSRPVGSLLDFSPTFRPIYMQSGWLLEDW